MAKLAVDAASGAQQSAHSLDRLGFFQYTAGDLKTGERHLRQALEIRKTKIWARHSRLRRERERPRAAVPRFRRIPEGRKLAEQAVAIRSKLLGGRDPRVAESLNTLGGVLVLLRANTTAIARMEEALAIHESQSPPEFSEEYGTLCINLAGTYQRVGRYASAEALFEKGLDILRVKPGVNHPAYSASLVGYAYLQADLGHYSTAEKLYDGSRETAARTTGRPASGLRRVLKQSRRALCADRQCRDGGGGLSQIARAQAQAEWHRMP